MTRYKLTIAYDGTAYSGWQRQPDPAPTVQREIEKAVANIVSHPVAVQGCSRTDAGVHAKGQVAAMSVTPPPGLAGPADLERFRRAINSRLPDDILIRSLQETSPDFNVRTAKSKRYRYLIWNHPDRPVFHRHYVYHHYRPLDLPAMQSACQHFVGEHDFEAFKAQTDERDNTTRTIFHCAIRARSSIENQKSKIENPPLLIFSVEGSGFLYRMVRTMVGTLLEIGLAKRPPTWIPEILASKNRRHAGPCAPPQGLCLQWIRF